MAGCGEKRQYFTVKKQASKQPTNQLQKNHSNVIASLEEKRITNSKFTSFFFSVWREKNE